MICIYLIPLLISVTYGKSFIPFPQIHTDTGFRRVCYHTNWAQYRPGIGQFEPGDIDPSLCTHLIYSFAKCEDNQLKCYEWNDESTDWSKGNFEKFNDLKLRNRNLKTLLAVGGWNHASTGFTTMVASQSSRNAFITQSIQYLRKWGFDGIDLDWEYPAARGGVPEDKERFTLLVKEFRTAFEEDVKGTNNERLLLTAAVAAGEDKIVNGYEIGLLSVYFDFINVMTYDLHGSWDPVTGMHSALKRHPSEKGEPNAKLNQASAIQMWIDGGAPPSKLNLGIPTYGRTFKLKNPSQNGVGAPAAGAGDAGPFTREGGFLSYYEICQKLEAGATRVWDPIRKVPYAYWSNQWVSYDDKNSVALKVDWMKDKGLGGVLVWALDLDDFNGNCESGEKWPLLKKIKSQLESNSRAVNPSGDEIDASVTTPSTSESAEFSCQGKPIGFYPNPTDCTSYIICVSDTRQDMTCAYGNHWNAVLNRCDPPVLANCVIPEMTTLPPPTTMESDPSSCEGISVGLASDPSDCSKYFFCYQGVVVATQSCAPGTLFDPTKRYCNTANQVICADQSTTTNSPSACSSDMTGAVPHDTDCSKYYVCYNYAIVATQGCPVGTLFDPQRRFCNHADQVICGSVDVMPTEASSDSVCKSIYRGQVAHPTDCSKYFVCRDGEITETKTCPPDLLFSPDLRYCNWPSLVTCRTSAITNHQPTTLLPTTSSQQIVNLEEFCSSQADGYYSHPHECNGFIQCVGSRTYVKQCPNNLHWNAGANACDWPKNAGCQPETVAQLENTSTLEAAGEFTCSGRSDGKYPNAANKNKWYWCVHSKLYHMDCPSQLVWDNDLKVCGWP